MFRLFLLSSLICLSSICVSAQNEQIEKPLKSDKDLSKPLAKKTDDVKKDDSEGLVKLKVTFLTSGEVSSVYVLSAKTKDNEDLDTKLVEQAVDAAKALRFEPSKKKFIKIVVYKFTIS